MSWNPLRKFSSKESTQMPSNLASSFASNVANANSTVGVSSSSSSANLTSKSSSTEKEPTLPPTLPVDSKANDSEIERIVTESAIQLNKVDERLQTLDNQCKAILRLGKRLADCTLTLSRYQNKLSDELAGGSLCQQHSDKLRNLLQDMRTFDIRCNRAADQRAALLMRTLLEPVKKLRAALAQLKQAARQQQRAHAQLDKCKAKVTRASERERSAGNLVRLHETRQQWRRLCTDCAAGTERVLSEVNALADARVPYLQPAFEALIKAELLLWADALQAFTTDQPINYSALDNQNHSSTGNENDSFSAPSSMAGLLSVTAAAAAMMNSPSPPVPNESLTWSPERHSNSIAAANEKQNCDDFSMFQIKRLNWNEYSQNQNSRLEAIAQLSIVEGVQ